MTTQDFYSQNNTSSSSEWVSAHEMKTLLEALDAPPSVLLEAILAAREEDAMSAAQPRPEGQGAHSQEKETPAGWLPFGRKSILGGIAIVLLVMLLVVSFKVIPGFKKQPKDTGKTPTATPQVAQGTQKPQSGTAKEPTPTPAPTKQQKATKPPPAIAETPVTPSPSPETSSPTPPTSPTPTPIPLPTLVVQIAGRNTQESPIRLGISETVPLVIYVNNPVTENSPITVILRATPTNSLEISPTPISVGGDTNPTNIDIKTSDIVTKGVLSFLYATNQKSLRTVDFVILPKVMKSRDSANIRKLPSTLSTPVTPPPSISTPLLVVGVTDKDPSGYQWFNVQWRNNNDNSTELEGWLRQDVAIDFQTEKSLAENEISKWVESQVVSKYPWPVPGEYQAKAFTLYSDSSGASEKKIVALSEGGTVKVLSNEGNNSDSKQAEVDGEFVKVEVTFWVPKEWYQNGGQWQQPEEGSTLKVCWSPGEQCKDDSGFNFDYFNQQRIGPNPNSQDDWLQMTVQGWMKKERILSEQLQSQ